MLEMKVFPKTSLRKTSIQKYELPQNCPFSLPFLTVIAFHRAKKLGVWKSRNPESGTGAENGTGTGTRT